MEGGAADAGPARGGAAGGGRGGLGPDRWATAGEPLAVGRVHGAALPTGEDPPVAVFAALADPMRWRLLALLADHEHSASALARQLPISRPGVLKHLAVLERGDLVQKHRAGREVRYGVRPERLADTARWIEATATAWDHRLDALRRLAEGDAGSTGPGAGSVVPDV
ncbi:ArsR/SmtB family transcription factor [Jiangella alba]|uniref:DNA-binding transcriptional regulator, ArsR family n=1 Tax=Jiangella alba TaxID=561176 RepID=A0A1H5PPJ8_9ACTN|nr:metalloregulator ArsR/SmtB family transcription factor [Jiangella alba]SEF15750.1 DNA-binding transcriptional regulator, ArsR family [Jiangella alba]